MITTRTITLSIGAFNVFMLALAAALIWLR